MAYQRNGVIQCLTPDSRRLTHNTPLNTAVQDLSVQFQRQQVDDALLQQVGWQLWQHLQIDTAVLACTDANCPCHFIIDTADASRQALPWECLYHPQYGFLGQHPHVTLSRTAPAQQVMPAISTVNSHPSQLKILLFTAQTAHLPTLEPEVEQYQLYQALAADWRTGHVHLLMPDTGSFAYFKQLMQQQAWDVVILSGHGVLNPKLGTTDFVFEHFQYPSGERIAADTLSQVFQHSAVRCVILAACYSAYTTSATVTPNLATQVAAQGVPYVIGMREPVLDRAGQVFSRTFCQHWVAGDSVASAVQHGRRAMTRLLATDEIWDSAHQQDHQTLSGGQWSLPMLLINPNQIAAATAYTEARVTTHDPQPSREYANLPPPPPLFIGRRHELATLTGLWDTQSPPPYLLIYGIGGIGKTALVQQLIFKLAQLGYHSQQLTDLEHVSQWLAAGDWPSSRLVLWVDAVCSQRDIEAWQTVIEPIRHLLQGLIITTRVSPQGVVNLPEWQTYGLTAPPYQDFVRYVRHLGLHYQPAQMKLLYHILQGNYHGVQLLQNFPHCETGYAFTQQVHLVKRYLVAYQRC